MYIPVYTTHKVFTYLSLYKTSSSCTRPFCIDIPTLSIVPLSGVVIWLLLLEPRAGKKTTGEDEDDDDDDASEESSKRSIPSRSEVFDQYTNGPDPPADDEDDDGDSTDEDEEQDLQKQVQRHEDV